MRRLLQKSEIGKLQSLLMIRGAPHQSLKYRRCKDNTYRADVLFDMSVEDIDLARFPTSTDPAEVSVIASSAVAEFRPAYPGDPLLHC